MLTASATTKRSASEMARLARQKPLSPLELVEAHLERIGQLNPKLNAFTCVRTEEEEAEARRAEQAVVSGEAKPLVGVPISIKSCIDVKGLRCEAGSRLRDGYVASEDAVLAGRLKRAGAIVLGNTSTPEVLMAYHTDNVLQGRTNNPWDLARTPGGSSGGEAAAIAAAMSAAGLGSGSRGSIRLTPHLSRIY